MSQTYVPRQYQQPQSGQREYWGDPGATPDPNRPMAMTSQSSGPPPGMMYSGAQPQQAASSASQQLGYNVNRGPVNYKPSTPPPAGSRAAYMETPQYLQTLNPSQNWQNMASAAQNPGQGGFSGYGGGLGGFAGYGNAGQPYNPMQGGAGQSGGYGGGAGGGYGGYTGGQQGDSGLDAFLDTGPYKSLVDAGRQRIKSTIPTDASNMLAQSPAFRDMNPGQVATLNRQWEMRGKDLQNQAGLEFSRQAGVQIPQFLLAQMLGIKGLENDQLPAKRLLSAGDWPAEQQHE